MPTARRHLVPAALALAVLTLPQHAFGQDAAAVAASPKAASEPAPLPYPAGLSLPVRLVGIDPADSGLARPALTAAAPAVAAAWLAGPQTLTAALAGKATPTINARRRTDRMLVGRPSSPLPAPAVTVEAAWCSLMDRQLLFVTVADTERNTLLASRHAAVPTATWRQLAKTGGLAGFLPGKLAELTRAAVAAASGAGAPAADALKIGLSLGRSVDRQDEGSSLCVDLLLEEALAPDYTVVRSLGGDHLALLRDLLGQPAHLARPTRGFVLRWANPPEEAPRRALPVKLTLTATVAETVFGHHEPISHQSTWEFRDGPNGTIAFTVDPGFRRLLDDERATLRLADWPEVAKVDRAWVWVDRGRAWGLKMGDRLVAEVDGKPVKGHVVSFYGPEAGVTSPRGFPVREGAILYIRLNQRLPRIGTEFHMDPRTFPTPFPLKNPG